MARSFISLTCQCGLCCKSVTFRNNTKILKCGTMKGKYKSRLISKGNIFFMRLSTASFQLANVPFFVKDVRETAVPERRADKLNGI